MFPELHLTPTFALPTYFVVVALASVLGSLWFIRRTDQRELNRTVALDLIMVVLFTGFLGARLFHVWYEEPTYYLDHPLAIFKIWNGGFVFFGGLLGATLGAMWYCQWRREPFWLWADLATLPTSLAYAVGRVGCFLNGCCYGRECQLPWATTVDGVLRHPAPLYATAWEVLLVLILLPLEKRWRRPGTFFHVWLIGHAVGRVLMESFRADPRGPVMASLSVGTWLSLVLGSLAATHLALLINKIPSHR